METGGKDREKVLARILAFSDGVFAFAITLLILDVKLPADVTKADLGTALVSLLPNYLAFLLSFIVIGVYWISHVMMFREIVNYDDRLIWINLFYLLFIVVIPFSTSILSLHLIQVSVMVYAGLMACTGYMHTILRLYLRSHQYLLHEKHSPAFLRQSILYSLIMPVGFTVSIGIASFSITIAQLFWVLIFLVSVMRWGKPREA
jgi:uncharacterized membrane protein